MFFFLKFSPECYNLNIKINIKNERRFYEKNFFFSFDYHTINES